MKKAQVLILLILITLAVYHFSQTEKATQKPSSQAFIKPSILPTKPPVINCPPIPIMARKSPSTATIMPTNLPNQEPVYFPSAEFREISPDDQYRQTLLTLGEDWLASLSNWQQKSKITQVISLLQSENKARWEYLQAVWSLRGMEGFEFYCEQSFREWVGLPVEPKPTEAFDDGWLTDDNLEFILKNHPGIQAALARQNRTSKKFHLRTDIANVYNAFYKAKSKQTWDLAEYVQELEWNKAEYTLFPLRVNGNHWGLFILSEREEEPRQKPTQPTNPNMIYCPEAEEVTLVREVYYTSSGGADLETEKTQLQPFIEQICGEGTEIKVILPTDRESKGYDCGVYLVKYVEEVLENGALELKREYSREECQEFRWEWKGRIGEGWCRWD